MPYKMLYLHLYYYHSIYDWFYKAIVSQYEGLSALQTNVDVPSLPCGVSL